MEKLFGKILKTQTMVTVKRTLSQIFSQEFSEVLQQSFFIKHIQVIFPRWMMNRELDFYLLSHSINHLKGVLQRQICFTKVNVEV